jgi:hypothetical protein
VLYDSYTVSLDKLVKQAYDRLDVVKVILIILLVLEVSQCQSINQLHVFLARGEPKKGATPKPPLVITNR